MGAVLLRVTLFAAALALGANATWLAVTANLTLGTALAGLFALGLGAWAVLLPRLRHPRLVSAGVGTLCVGVLTGSLFLAWFGSHDNARGDEQAVIVLGAAVHGRELSHTLQARLDAALAYHDRNPAAVIVVSGGRGPQEDLPEALAMQEYLEGRGVRPTLILRDDRSTSTEENFALSLRLLDARLTPGYTVAFVTSDFHVYRAERIAQADGLTVRHVSAPTPWYFWPTDYLREIVMVVRMWVSLG